MQNRRSSLSTTGESCEKWHITTSTVTGGHQAPWEQYLLCFADLPVNICDVSNNFAFVQLIKSSDSNFPTGDRPSDGHSPCMWLNVSKADPLVGSRTSWFE